MSKIKKVLAMIIALAMVLGTTLTAFAETVPAQNSNQDRGNVTIQGLNEGDTVQLYQIVKADYEGNKGAFSGYSVVDTYKNDIHFEPIETDIPGIKYNYEISENDLAAVSAKITDAIQPDGTETVEAGAKSVTISGLPVGSYLVKVIPAANNSTIYSPAVASIYYVANSDQSGNEMNQGTLDMENGNTYVKKQDEPTLDKKIVEGDKEVSGNSANIGDTVDFVIKADIPSYTGSYPVFEITDILDGLTFKEIKSIQVLEDSTVVKDLTNNYNFKESTTEDGKPILTMDFVTTKDGVKTFDLQDYHGKKLVINYSATVNANAHLNEIANTNKATLKYTNDSSVNIDDDKLPKDDDNITYTYTYDIDGKLTGTDKENVIDTTHILNKLGEEIEKITTPNGTKEVKKALKDAEFTLYTNEECTDRYQQNGVDYPAIVSDEEGQLEIKGLEGSVLGTKYYLKETKAPEGYSINPMVVAIEIKHTLDDKGKLKSWAVTIDGDKTSTFTVSYEGTTTVERNDSYESADDSKYPGYNIYNTKISSLPSTGGIGTTIFTIGGCLIMIVAAGLFFASRRKSAK